MSSYRDPALRGAVYPSEEELDPAGAGIADMVQLDPDGDGLPDVAYIDSDRDGQLDTVLHTPPTSAP